MRYTCVRFAYPLTVHPDEPWIVDAALKMVHSGDLNPHGFIYPSLNIYLQAILFYTVGFLEKCVGTAPLSGIPEITFYVAGRTLNVFLSVATIIATFDICRRLVSAWGGVAAACFIAASSLHMTNSFIITVDSSVAFWSSLSVLMATMIYTRGIKRSYYLAAGIFGGFTIGCKYTAFPIIVPMVIAGLYDARRQGSYANIAIGLSAVGIGFLFSTPYALFDHAVFLDTLFFVRNAYGGHLGAESMASTSYILYLKSLVLEGYGLMPTILACVGLFLVFSRDRGMALVLASFPVGLFLFVGAYKTFFLRNLVAVVPFLAVFSGIGVHQAAERLQDKYFHRAPRWQKGAALVLGSILVIMSAYGQLSRDHKTVRASTLPDSRWVALKWIDEHLPAGSHIGREHYTPPIEKYSDRFHVSYWGLFAVARPRDTAEKIRSLDFMVVSSGDYGRFIQHPDVYPTQAQTYRDFFERHELVKEFRPDGKSLSGPTIRIYGIRK
jgi:4-amino-4-deoxy-L-arabinose transferase-like glycosyltransferase